MYELSKKLIIKLRLEKITYCHWKSNLLLNEALNGYDDLDLLVAKSDIAKFESTLLELGFKEASNKNISFNGIKHFYGYDESSGELLHLHIYYQIKTGPSWIKSMRFDFEEYILEHLTLHRSGMPIPQKEIELVLFVFRVMLKYSKIHEFILVNREKERTLKEIEYLSIDLNEKRLKEFLDIYFDNISKEEFFGYIDIIKKGTFFKKYSMGKRLKDKLAKYNSLTFTQEIVNNLTQFSYRVINKIFLKEKKKLHSSGAMIVVAGLDATGKSTITKELKKWLGKNFTLSLIHFGKPPSTLITFVFNILIKLARKSSNNQVLKSSIKNENSQKSFFYLIRQVILAYDRYQLAKKYWNKTSLGEIVLCDRYKSENFGVMDSKRLNAKNYTGIKKKLAEFENRLYDNIPQPDILFYLIVPVEEAVIRNKERIKEGKESEEFIRVRHKENKNLFYKAKIKYITDTNREYERVIKEIKARIWRAI